jgi:hypothetical protein
MCGMGIRRDNLSIRANSRKLCGVSTGQGKIVAQRASNAKHAAYYNVVGSGYLTARNELRSESRDGADRPTSVSCKKLLYQV